jgi:hypothetical protein
MADTTSPPFTCPICHTSSASPDDHREGYCGHCHDFTAMKAPAAHKMAGEMFDATAAGDFRNADALLAGLTSLGAPYVAQAAHWLAGIIRGAEHGVHDGCAGTFIPCAGACQHEHLGIQAAHDFVLSDALGDSAGCALIFSDAWRSHVSNTGDFLADFLAALLVGAVECSASPR